MTCEKRTELLIDWLEGELSPEEAEAVELLVAQDPDCAREVEEIRRALEAVAHPAEEPGETYFASFYPRLRQNLATVRIPWFRRFWNWFWAPGVWVRAGAAAAIVMVAVVSTLVFTGQLPNGDSYGEPTFVAKKGVAITKRNAGDIFDVANVNPELRKAVATLKSDELDDLRLAVTEMMVDPLLDDAEITLPGALPASPSAADYEITDLHPDEIVEVADQLSISVKNWKI
ncbi:MAG: hypothetical protein P9L99_05760 [Candidatus Lernaella stagnicola]|nr:hypothetical protein [Candidatus Lernaella stagnicola]